MRHSNTILLLSFLAILFSPAVAQKSKESAASYEDTVHYIQERLDGGLEETGHCLRRVTAALTAFGNVYLHGKPKANPVTPKKRTISAAGRKRIAAAQKARWAKFKATKKAKRSKA